MPIVPFKANAARRHHIPKQRHQVTNWSAMTPPCAGAAA
jgi:hypothetical protein